jgi:hypothetical protein
MNSEYAVPIFIPTESSRRPNSALDHILRIIGKETTRVIGALPKDQRNLPNLANKNN